MDGGQVRSRSARRIEMPVLRVGGAAVVLTTLAVVNYRSLTDIAIELRSLNVVTGPNGSGKSNLYKALRLTAETASGGVVNALAREGGLQSTFWAGPEEITKRMKAGSVPVQGGPRQRAVRMRLGFADEDFAYAISLGLPPPSGRSKFTLDPEIKRETIWAGGKYRPASALVEREGPLVKLRDGRRWAVIERQIGPSDSLFGELADPERAPEILALRDRIRSWRFYDHFRTDEAAAARAPQLGTRTPVLHHSGRDLAAAIQTILEIGDADALAATIDDAFPGSTLQVDVQADTRFSIGLNQPGLLRPMQSAEFSDGTLRYLLLVAALLTPRPPPLLVLNEPETSLHPDLLPALARLIIQCARQTQVWVVSHATRLVAALEAYEDCNVIALEKELGETVVVGQGLLDGPSWSWPPAG